MALEAFAGRYHGGCCLSVVSWPVCVRVTRWDGCREDDQVVVVDDVDDDDQQKNNNNNNYNSIPPPPQAPAEFDANVVLVSVTIPDDIDIPPPSNVAVQIE